KQIDGLSCLGAQRRELMKSRWTRVAGGLPLGRRATNRGGPHIGSDHVEHSEQQRLKSVEPVRRRPIETEGDQLVEPGREHAGAVFAEVEYLGGLGVQLVGEVLRVK